MGFLIVAGGLIGAVVGLLAGGIFGFFKAKKKDANKFVWTVCGMLAGALAIGAAGFGITFLMVAAEMA